MPASTDTDSADRSHRRHDTRRRAPWHLWLIGFLALLWYLAGALTIQMAQLGRLPGLTPDEVDYYAEKSVALVAITGISTYGSLLASVLLLLRRRAATRWFVIALLCILLGNSVELAMGTSRVTANTGAATATFVIVLIAVAMPLYSRAMSKRWVMR